MTDRARDKIVRMALKGFSPDEIHRACCEKWPDEPVSLNEVCQIVLAKKGAAK